MVIVLICSKQNGCEWFSFLSGIVFIYFDVGCYYNSWFLIFNIYIYIWSGHPHDPLELFCMVKHRKKHIFFQKQNVFLIFFFVSKNIFSCFLKVVQKKT